MKKMLAAATAGLALCASASPAAATVITDPIGDFIGSFAGPNAPDLDVTTFSAVFNPESRIFTLGGTLAGTIDPENDFYYVIGVNTGAGAIAPFGSIGQPNVIFDQVVVVGGEGEAFVGANDLAFTISGNTFSVDVPLSLLPSTGFGDPLLYAWNLWPRTQIDNPGDVTAISDFAPDNAMINASAVPEPGTWAMLLFGFVAVGVAIRRRRIVLPQFA
jgi:hypothetical protein